MTTFIHQCIKIQDAYTVSSIRFHESTEAQTDKFKARNININGKKDEVIQITKILNQKN